MSAPFIPVIFTGTQQKMFRKFFNQPLSKFTLKNGLGFDIVLFDSWLKVPDGVSTNDFIEDHFSSEHVSFIRELCQMSPKTAVDL